MSKQCIAWSGKVFNNCEILNPIDKTLIKSIDWWYTKCHCGNIFKATPHDLKRGNTISCKCIMKANSSKTGKANKKDYYHNYINKFGVKIIKPVIEELNKITDQWILLCPLCNTKFNGLARHVIDENITSCKCRRIENGKKYLIKKHQINRIRQGFKKDEYMSKFSFLIRKMIFHPIVNLILKIDNNTCLLCLKYHSKLDVHHIIPFKDNLNVQNKESFKSIYDINNLITLCRKCHRDIAHNGHGSKINLDIQGELLTITNTRPVIKELLEKYNIIVKEQIEPWINKYMCKT